MEIGACPSSTGSPAPSQTPASIGDSLVACGIRLSLGGTIYDPADPLGKMFFNILATFAEFEVDLLRLRTREGMAVARARPHIRWVFGAWTRYPRNLDGSPAEPWGWDDLVAIFFGRAAVAGAWTAVGLAVAIALFGQVLQPSHWVMDISPFTHAPRLPGGTVSAAPLVWLCPSALALTMALCSGPCHEPQSS